jgi:formyl-CoA transferase
MSPGPALEGLRVVELAHVIAGPLAGTLLADLGATVVHVEAPGGGDPARTMGPAKDGVPLWWKVAGRNKLSVTLDLREEAGRELARGLCARADVVITNFRADTLERWGLDWEGLHAVNRRLVYLQITGFGATGPLRSAPGFGKVGEARSGVVYLTGFPETPPVHTGFSHGDSVTALMGAFGVMAALYRRGADPDFEGEWIDLALFESLFRLIEWQVIVYDQLGIVPERTGNRLAVAPAAVINTYLTAEDEWIVVTSATSRSVQNVAVLLGFDAADFATNEQQLAAADSLDEAMREWVGARGTDECLAAMRGAEVVASRIFSARDIVEDEVYAAREDVVVVQDEELGAVRMQGVIPKLAQHPGRIWRTGTCLGADTRTVLADWLGLDDEQLDALSQAGVL